MLLGPSGSGDTYVLSAGYAQMQRHFNMSDARTELQTSAQMVYADPLKIKSFPAAQAEQVAASIVTRIDISRQFQGVNIYSKQECADCWARFFCSGGCMAHAWFANGDFTKPEEMACALAEETLGVCALCNGCNC